MKMLRLRPADCCAPPGDTSPLPERERTDLVSVFHALGDPTRLEIFRLIAAQHEPICVCDITARFDVTQPTISHHLRVLREAGLVTVARRGVWAYYSAKEDRLAVLGNVLEALKLAGKGVLA